MKNNSKNYFIHGAHNFICDKCGFKKKSTEKRKDWEGLVVCRDCWDPEPARERPTKFRQEQRPIIDARPETSDIHTTDTVLWNNDYTLWGDFDADTWN